MKIVLTSNEYFAKEFDLTDLDNQIILTKWDIRFYELAKHISNWSKDPSTKVGSIAANGKRQIGWGINGLPNKIKDDERLENRAWKYKAILHAEDNLLLHCGDLTGSTVYLYPLLSCSQCSSKLIQAGVDRVVARLNNNDRWNENLNLSRELFREAGVTIIEIEDNQ